LKWEYQLKQLQNQWEHYTDRSWKGTIVVQRSGIVDLLKENPSLKRFLSDAIIESYPTALKSAIAETGLLKSVFPNECPYTIEQLLDDNFYPKSKEFDFQTKGS